MSSDQCLYFTANGVAITWFHLFPTLIFLGLWAGSLRPDGTRVGVIFFYSLYLTMWNMALWALQVNFALVRPHELCGHVYTYAFPSIEAFLFGNIATAFLAYAYFKDIHVGWMNWVIIYSIAVFPQAFLVLVGYNRWWEVVVSFALGVPASMFFVSVVFIYIKPYIVYLESQAPFTWFHLRDAGYCLTVDEHQEAVQLKENIEHCEACIKRHQKRIDTHADFLKHGWC